MTWTEVLKSLRKVKVALAGRDVFVFIMEKNHCNFLHVSGKIFLDTMTRHPLTP